MWIEMATLFRVMKFILYPRVEAFTSLYFFRESIQKHVIIKTSTFISINFNPNNSNQQYCSQSVLQTLNSNVHFTVFIKYTGFWARAIAKMYNSTYTILAIVVDFISGMKSKPNT